MSLFCYALICVHLSFAIILKRKSKLVALLLLSFRCIVTINVLWLFLTVPWVVLQSVIVVLPDHTHLFFVCASLHFLNIAEGIQSKKEGKDIEHFYTVTIISLVSDRGSPRPSCFIILL